MRIFSVLVLFPPAPSSGNKSTIKEQTKSFPKEQFWLFSNPIKICLLRLFAEGIFYTYPHSIVPTDLGIRRNGQPFEYAYTTGADPFQSCIKNTLHRLWCRVSLIYSSMSSSRSRSVIGTFNAREKITKSISVTNRSPFSTRRIK